ncbi:MAG: rhodanese-like domain-containing protein [Nitrospirota bacterium]
MKWPSVKKMIRKKFPGVPEVSTAELDRWLAAADRPSPVLLDVRAAAEFAVSHLAGARPAPTADDALRLLRSAGKDHPIVAYCSVGYRSAAIVERLSAAGFTRVRNLEGSLFQWANEGRPVYRDGRAVEEVHPYDDKWGVLLDRDLWATSASD